MFNRTRLAAGAVTLLAFVGFVFAQTAPTSSPATRSAPSAARPQSDLKISLMDGSLLAGKLSVSELAIDTKYGPLKIPVDQIQSFAPGLQSHPQFAKKVSDLIDALSAPTYNDREQAQQDLTKMGTDLRGVLERELKNAVDEKQNRLQKILDDFEALQGDEEIDKVRLWVQDDLIVTPDFTIVGHITTPGFSVTGSYGTVQIKMEDVRIGRRDGLEPEEIRKNFTISGTAITQHAYTSTNIKLSKGDQVFITATGTISMTPWGNNAQSTPEGSPNFGSVGPGIFGGTLIGKLGESGTVVKVGSNLKFTADRGGVFELSIASPGDYQGNTFPGEYNVKIRVLKK
jgi:hypothetical protein